MGRQRQFEGRGNGHLSAIAVPARSIIISVVDEGPFTARSRRPLLPGMTGMFGSAPTFVRPSRTAAAVLSGQPSARLGRHTSGACGTLCHLNARPPQEHAACHVVRPRMQSRSSCSFHHATAIFPVHPAACRLPHAQFKDRVPALNARVCRYRSRNDDRNSPTGAADDALKSPTAIRRSPAVRQGRPSRPRRHAASERSTLSD